MRSSTSVAVLLVAFFALGAQAQEPKAEAPDEMLAMAWSARGMVASSRSSVLRAQVKKATGTQRLKLELEAAYEAALARYENGKSQLKRVGTGHVAELDIKGTWGVLRVLFHSDNVGKGTGVTLVSLPKGWVVHHLVDSPGELGLGASKEVLLVLKTENPFGFVVRSGAGP